MSELESEEAIGDGVQRDGIVSSQCGDEFVEVCLVGGEDEIVVDVHYDVSCLGGGGAIE